VIIVPASFPQRKKQRQWIEKEDAGSRNEGVHRDEGAGSEVVHRTQFRVKG